MQPVSATALFVPAAQPDIVRAAQKDQLYVEVVTEAVQDSARALLGPRKALTLARCFLLSFIFLVFDAALL